MQERTVQDTQFLHRFVLRFEGSKYPQMNSRDSVKVGLPNGLLLSPGLLSWSGMETDLSHYVLLQHLSSVQVSVSPWSPENHH